MNTSKFMCGLCIIAMIGCKKDKPGTGINVEKPDIPHTTQSVTVSFPDGMEINYADFNLFSLADDAKLDGAGQAMAAYDKGRTNIAWLFDRDDNLVMAGFVNDTLKTIDAASTAKVLLYYAYAMPMLPEGVQRDFVNGIGGIKGVSDWISRFTAILKNDRQALGKGVYLNALEHTVQGMGQQAAARSGAGNTEKVMTSPKSGPQAVKQADINVVGGGQRKSGVRVSSEDLSKITLTNHYRRRAHAFFYKTKFKDLNGMQKNILSEINETTSADKDAGVAPVEAITSFTGVVGIWIEGKDMEFAAKAGDPLDFPLQDHELEATYKVRVVGPGRWFRGTPLTNAEKQKMSKLEMETVAVDFLIPAFASSVASKSDFTPGPGATQAQRESLEALTESIRTVTEEMIKAIPGVYDEMQKGNYAGATRKVLEAVYAGNIGAAKDGFVKVMAILAKNAVEQGFYVSPQYDEVLAQKRMMKILELTDNVLQGSDYFRIANSIDNSKFLEEWELQLKSGQVTLLFEAGQDSVINTADETKIRAEIKNMAETGGDQHPYFEWSTTGKYGKLVDTKGHSGKEFATADHIVSYQSTTNSSDLGDGDNIDYIYVKASFNNVLIGMDTIAVNVKKITYEMKPTDGVVTGRKHGNAAHNVTLHLAKVITGVRDIPNHETLDFKVEWGTNGVYGELVGNTTTYNDDDMVYKATSDQAGVFYETITASVYARNKGETDYFFYGRAKASVKIDNDPKKKIIWVPMDQFYGHTTEPWTAGQTLHTCILSNGVTFKQDPDAESYSLLFMDMKNVIGAPKGHSWRAGAPSPYPPNAIQGPGKTDATYSVIYAWGSRNSYDGKHVEDINGYLAKQGGARITITLK